ncbi:microtubule-associated protein 4 isoform X4 [Hemicordylus capensis]|uniref:microtubule-associated protein 4 isoform X4 n=1 Tax=Hemicordylus capensis TaxID=884348 RepID=UPI0023034588|nr:microtubule-associated protein 4 isoform X4 [Hemicordylus capensis]
MADWDHNLSLADALTEPAPQIEEEVKRDFIATLEAEKFDDVVGETVGKTDYVPLLDDDDPKAGNQEAKTKPHAEGVPVERAPVTGPAAVVENGDHGIEGSRKVSPGKIMDEQMSYKEFLDRNDSWTMDDRNPCFDSQSAFKPMDVSEPFKMHREDVLSDLLLLPPEVTTGPPLGEYLEASREVQAPYGAAARVPEQSPLGPPHPSANIFDPLAFFAVDSGAESQLNQTVAASSKIPDVTEMHLPGSFVTGLMDLTGELQPSEAKSAAAAVPALAMEELMGFEPSLDHKSHPPKEVVAASPEAAATKDQPAQATEPASPGAGPSPGSEEQEGSRPPPGQRKEEEGSTQPRSAAAGQKVVESPASPSRDAEEAAATSPSQPAAGSKQAPTLHTEKEEESRALGQEVGPPEASPAQRPEKGEESQPSASQEVAAPPPPVPKAEAGKASPLQPAEKAEASKAPPGLPPASGGETQPPSSPGPPVEQLPVLEKAGEKKPPPSTPADRLEEHPQPPAAQPVERFPEPVESKESLPLAGPKADSQELLPEKPASPLAEVGQPKGAPIQPVELPQEKTPQEPAGLPPAQVRQTNQASDHRRSGRAKPPHVPVADAPESLLAGLPAQKSHSQGEDPFSRAECGYAAGTSPRSKAPHRKAAVEAQRDTLQESWDLEASAAFKKRKKKPKQKRSQQPRGVETGEENPERLKTPPCAAGPQKSEVPLAESQESAKEARSPSMEVLSKDTSKLGIEWQLPDAQSTAKGELTLPAENPFKLALDAKAGELGQVEAISKDSLKLQSKSRRKEPSEAQPKHCVEQKKQGSPTWPPAQASPAETSLWGAGGKPEGQPPKHVGFDVSSLEAKPALGKEGEVAPTKPAVPAEKVVPEGPTANGALVEEKPKQPESGGECERPGEEVRAVEASQAKRCSAQKEDRGPDALGPSCSTELPSGDAKGSGPAKPGKFALGPAEAPFFLEADAAERLDSPKGRFPEARKGAASGSSKEPAGAAPRVGSDQPKKRGSDGKSKRAKNSSERLPPQLFASEDRSDLSEAPGGSGFAAKGTEVSSSGVMESQTTLGSAGAGEKSKKGSSNGKSRKAAAERSSFGAPFFLEAEEHPGRLPTQVGKVEQTQEEGDFLAASQLLEVAADTAKLQALATASLMEKPKEVSTSKSEWVDFPSSAYPFILDAPVKGTEGPAAHKRAAPRKGAGLSDQGRGPSFTTLEDPTATDPSLPLQTSKPKKRTSDGRSKKSGKSPSEQPFLPETMAANKPPRKADATEEMGSADNGPVPGGTPLLEQLDRSQAQLPAGGKLVEGKGNVDSSSATKIGGSDQLPASDRKTSTAKPEVLAQTKEMPSTEEGEDARREHLVEDRTCALPMLPLRAPPAELAAEEQKKPDTKEQSPQVGSVLQAKPGIAGPAVVLEKAGKMEDSLSPNKGQGKGLDPLLKDAKAVGPVAAVPLGDTMARGAEEGRNRKSRSSEEHPFLWGAKTEADALLGAEMEEKPKEHSSASSSSSSKEARGDGGSDLAHRQEPHTKPAKKGSDGKSKRAGVVLEQAKADASPGQRPKGAGLEYTVGEMGLVDENRNIRSLPPGHPLFWEENTMSLFGPFASSGAGGPGEAFPQSQGIGCPFLEHVGKFAGELSKEHLPPEMLQDASKSDRRGQHELQENLAKLEGREAMIEASLLVKAGDETREKRKKSKRPPSESLAGKNGKARKDQLLSPVLAEDGGAHLLDKTQGSGPGSLELAVAEEQKVLASVPADGEGGSDSGRESSLPAAECPTLGENKAGEAALQAPTTVLVGSAEQAGVAGSGKEARREISECLESLGSQAGADKAPEDAHTQEVASASAAEDPPCEHPGQGGADEPKLGPPVQAAGEEEEVAAASLSKTLPGVPDTLRVGTEGGGRVELVRQAAAECVDQGARAAKREGRARAPEQIKGYMRPTKSRGLPPPPPLPPPEPGRRRPAKPDGPTLPRQDRVKPEEIKPVAEVGTVNDVAAPLSKELPPSPEKKTKPSASAPAAKPAAAAAAAAAKTKPAPSTAAPTKRPASTTPGPNKKATSPTAGPPKRPAASTTRPSTLTPKDSKPKGADAKSPDKRASPSKPPSATTPRPGVRSSPATPRPSTALTSTNASSPRSSATSPPKRPSTIKTDAKPTDAKKTTAKSPSADLSRPKSAPASTTAKSSATTPTAASPALPGAAASRPKPKPAAPKLSGTASMTADSKKASTLKAAPKTSPVPKPPRPTTSVSAPDLKNVRSKIGSTDNIKHQPGGGKAKVERKAESAGAARKPEPNAVSKLATTKTAVSKEGAPKQPNGKVQIVSKKANYSHIQSKCGSKDNIKHVPGGGNVPNAQRPSSGSHPQPSTVPKPGLGGTHVQIQNKKIDLSKVASKCGSKTNIKHKPGGGDVRIENQKLNFKDKAQAKVGSLDNVGHVPAGGIVKIESHKLTFREKAKARTDHGADPVASNPPVFSGSTSPRRSTSVSESLSSVAAASLLPPPPPPPPSPPPLPRQAPRAEETSASLSQQGL